MTLETYAKARSEFRARVLAHKSRAPCIWASTSRCCSRTSSRCATRSRRCCASRRSFEEEGIQDELDAYNPLVPDGTNFKATMLIEYEDVEERQRGARASSRASRIAYGSQVAGQSRKVFAIADEDLERENDDKTSAVHFLRFELDAGDGRGAQERRGARHRRRPSALRGGDSGGRRGDPRRRWPPTSRRRGRRPDRGHAASHSARAWRDPRRPGRRSTRRTPPPRRGAVASRVARSDIPHFARTRPDAGLRARWIAVSVSTSRRENAIAIIGARRGRRVAVAPVAAVPIQ